MKIKHKVTIEETVSEDFKIEVDNIEAALEIAEKNYKSSKFVLELGNIICKQICAESFDGADTVE